MNVEITIDLWLDNCLICLSDCLPLVDLHYSRQFLLNQLNIYWTGRSIFNVLSLFSKWYHSIVSNAIVWYHFLNIIFNCFIWIFKNPIFKFEFWELIVSILLFNHLKLNLTKWLLLYRFISFLFSNQHKLILLIWKMLIRLWQSIFFVNWQLII